MITVEKVKEEIKEELQQENIVVSSPEIVEPVKKVWYKKPAVIIGGGLLALGLGFLVYKKVKGNGTKNIDIT